MSEGALSNYKKYKSKYDKLVNQHPKCLKTLENIIEYIHESKENCCPINKINEKDMQLLIDLDIVKLIKENICFVNKDIYNYFLAHKLLEDYLLDKWYDYHEFIKEYNSLRYGSDHRSLGNFILLIINNEYKKDVCCAVGEIGKLESNLFWDIYSNLMDVFLYLNLNIDDLSKLLEISKELVENDIMGGLIYQKVEKLANQRSDFAQSLLDRIITEYETDKVFFIPAIIKGLSKEIDLKQIFNKAYELINENEKILKKMGILSCSVINYNQDSNKLLDKLFSKYNSLMEEEDEEILAILAKSYGNLIRYNHKVINNVVQLSHKEIPLVQYEVAKILRRNTELSSEDWYKESLKKLSSVSVEYRGVIQEIKSCLLKLIDIDKELIFDYLQFSMMNHDILDNEKDRLAKDYGDVFIKLYEKEKDLLEEYISKWFCKDDDEIHYFSAGIIHVLSENKKHNIKLNKSILQDLKDKDIKFIILKILGYTNLAYGRVTCELIFSIIDDDISEELINFVKEIFIKYIGYNYPGITEEFIEGIKNGENKLKIDIVRKIENNLNNYYDKLKNLDRLNEFKSSERRIRRYIREDRKKFSKSMQSNIPDNSLLNFVKRIPLKGGKKWFTKINGKYTEKTPLKAISTKMEIPKGEHTDPVGQEILRYNWRLLSREDLE